MHKNRNNDLIGWWLLNSSEQEYAFDIVIWPDVLIDLSHAPCINVDMRICCHYHNFSLTKFYYSNQLSVTNCVSSSDGGST